MFVQSARSVVASDMTRAMVRTSTNIKELGIGIDSHRKSGSENVCRKGIRIMTAELALVLIYKVSVLDT